MYVLYPVSIHSRPGVMSFSFLHLLRLWVNAVVGEEWAHLVCVGCRGVVGMFGEGQWLVPVVLIVIDKCS